MVQRFGQLAVSRSRGGKLGFAFLQERNEFDVALFQSRDVALEFVNVGRGTQTRLAPHLFPQRLGEPPLQLLHASAQARIAGLGVGEISL